MTGTTNGSTAVGWAARDSSGVLSPFSFPRRKNGDEDVTIKILFCGICHSDLHCIRNEWQNTVYPVVAGHEIAGIITEVGCNATRFKVGEKVGVGCMVNSCRSCDSCDQHLENYCPKIIFTYNSLDTDGTVTYGGYSDTIVVNEHFVVRFPENLPMDKGAPLLCAGVTVYSSSPNKEAEAVERLGADAFLVSSNPEAVRAAASTMDGIINTVSAVHPIAPLISMLKAYGKMIMLGIPEKPLELPIITLIMAGRIVAGSSIGGMEETQEMIDFAGKHGITADIELVPMDYVNQAMERLAKGDVRYRFVIDVGNTLAAP